MGRAGSEAALATYVFVVHHAHVKGIIVFPAFTVT